MNAMILAGGKSSRMGFDKAFIQINGVALIKKQALLLKELFKQVIIAVNNRSKKLSILRLLGGRTERIMLIQDLIPSCGPLGGIYSGLYVSNSNHNFVVACDMPFLDKNLIKYICKQADSTDFDLVIPKINNRYEPLFCVYSRNCLPYIKQLLDKRKFRIRELIPLVKTKEITDKDISRFTSRKNAFVNINSRKELVRCDRNY